MEPAPRTKERAGPSAVEPRVCDILTFRIRYVPRTAEEPSRGLPCPGALPCPTDKHGMRSEHPGRAAPPDPAGLPRGRRGPDLFAAPGRRPALGSGRFLGWAGIDPLPGPSGRRGLGPWRSARPAALGQALPASSSRASPHPRRGSAAGGRGAHRSSASGPISGAPHATAPGWTVPGDAFVASMWVDEVVRSGPVPAGHWATAPGPARHRSPCPDRIGARHGERMITVTGSTGRARSARR